MTVNNDKKIKIKSDKAKSIKGSDYLNRMTPEEFIKWMKSIPLQMALTRSKKRDSYIDALNEDISALKEDSSGILQFLQSEKNRIQKDSFIAKLKNKGQDILLLSDQQDVLIAFNNHHTNHFEDLNNNFLITKVEAANTNSVIKEPTSSQEDTIEELPKDFAQIKCDAEKEYIEKFFMVLSKAKNPLNHDPFMQENDVRELLEKNFIIFEKKASAKYFPINLIKNQKIILRYFMFQFYQKAEINFTGPKYKYANFLIHNFDIFKDDKLKTLMRNM